MAVGPAKTQSSLGIRIKKASVLSYPLSAQRRPWSEWADAEADLSLRWAHSHFVGFVMSRLNYTLNHKLQLQFQQDCLFTLIAEKRLNQYYGILLWLDF